MLKILKIHCSNKKILKINNFNNNKRLISKFLKKIRTQNNNSSLIKWTKFNRKNKIHL